MPKTSKAKKTTTVTAKRGRKKIPDSEKKKGKKIGMPILEEAGLYLDVDDLNLIVRKYSRIKSGVGKGDWQYTVFGYFPKTIVGFRYMLDRVVCEYAIENIDIFQIMERMDRMEETIKSIKWGFK